MTHPVTHPATSALTNPITITTTINSPVAAVWAAYNDPRQVEQWNFASPDWECRDAHSDLREGGSFGSRMAARDGSMGFEFGGTYTSVKAPHELAYQIGDGRRVSVTFEPVAAGDTTSGAVTAGAMTAGEGDQTRVTIQFEPESSNPAEMQQAGWQAILESFKRYVDARAAR